jgi:hypothetical protein
MKWSAIAESFRNTDKEEVKIDFNAFLISRSRPSSGFKEHDDEWPSESVPVFKSRETSISLPKIDPR